ncbi:hypothetical protein JCM18897A_32610 [Streptomyces sp. JCM 18897]
MRVSGRLPKGSLRSRKSAPELAPPLHFAPGRPAVVRRENRRNAERGGETGHPQRAAESHQQETDPRGARAAENQPEAEGQGSHEALRTVASPVAGEGTPRPRLIRPSHIT